MLDGVDPGARLAGFPVLVVHDLSKQKGGKVGMEVPRLKKRHTLIGCYERPIAFLRLAWKWDEGLPPDKVN